MAVHLHLVPPQPAEFPGATRRPPAASVRRGLENALAALQVTHMLAEADAAGIIADTFLDWIVPHLAAHGQAEPAAREVCRELLSRLAIHLRGRDRHPALEPGSAA